VETASFAPSPVIASIASAATSWPAIVARLQQQHAGAAHEHRGAGDEHATQGTSDVQPRVRRERIRPARDRGVHGSGGDQHHGARHEVDERARQRAARSQTHSAVDGLLPSGAEPGNERQQKHPQRHVVRQLHRHRPADGQESQRRADHPWRGQPMHSARTESDAIEHQAADRLTCDDRDHEQGDPQCCGDQPLSEHEKRSGASAEQIPPRQVAVSHGVERDAQPRAPRR